MLRKLQMFFEFANFYCRFVECYAKIIRFLTKFLKSNNQNKQNEFFVFDINFRVVFVVFIIIFTKIFMFVYFDFKNRIKIEIDAFNFVIATILSQLIFRFVDNVETT